MSARVVRLPQTVDLYVWDEGTVWAFEPVSPAARRWIEEHVPSESWQWLGPQLVVDHRCAWRLIEALMEAGLRLQIPGARS